MRRTLLHVGIILFWLLIWHIISVSINQQILLVSPLKVLERLGELALRAGFWQAVANSLTRIVLGFAFAVISGIILAALAQRSAVYLLINPLLSLMKATPVASVTILVLFWIPGNNLSIVIAYMMVLPLIYYNVYEGLRQVDGLLLEMASVYRLGFLKRLRYIIIPSVKPFLLSACSISFGQAWKSGIAAEVIALPRDSIGINLYNAKVYLENADLLAWTVVIVLLSYIMEKTVLFALRARD